MKEEAASLRRLFDLHAGSSQASFARQWNLGSGSMVSQYLSDRRPLNLTAALRFARGLKVPLREFSPRLAAEVESALHVLSPLEAATPIDAEHAQVRCVRLRLKSGVARFGMQPIKGVGEFIAFRRDWLAARQYDSTRLLAVEAEDDGMQPTLWKFDLVVINTADRQPHEAAVFAINYEGELKLRRTIRDIGEWWLHCDNQDGNRFPRKQLDEKHCFILGRVIHRQSEFI